MDSKTFIDPVFGKEEMIPYTCPCCVKCWFIIKSKQRQGRCVHGGPYKGYVNVEEQD